jgi:hypothetical protein
MPRASFEADKTSRPIQRWLRLLWRALRAVLLTIAAVVIAVEEWGWRPLTAWAARLACWPPVARLEELIRSASPKTALALFLIPAVMLFPLKLLALWLIHVGHQALGIAVIVAAKVLGTALVGRLFIITEPQLIRFAWFARSLAWWRNTKQRVRVLLTQSLLWRRIKRAQRGMSLWLRRWMRGVR